MTNNSEPTPVNEFPLRMGTAKKTINNLATDHKQMVITFTPTRASAGERITVVIALKEIDVDPEAKTVTVYVE